MPELHVPLPTMDGDIMFGLLIPELYNSFVEISQVSNIDPKCSQCDAPHNKHMNT